MDDVTAIVNMDHINIKSNWMHIGIIVLFDKHLNDETLFKIIQSYI